MGAFELKNIDPEEIEDVLVEIERSFNIKFIGNELTYVNTFDALCDHITEKIKLENTNDCTSQQAFYKLKNAIGTSMQIDKKTIVPQSSLYTLLPRPTRRLLTQKIEQELGFEINILRPPHWLSISLSIILFASLITFSVSWKIALPGLCFSIGGLWLAYKVGNELDLETVGQIAKKMTKEKYFKSRRNPTTRNKKEIEQIVKDRFVELLDLNKNKLTRESTFV